jgi:signal transduction histidine kinase/ActR/RegA family two-component response regulator
MMTRAAYQDFWAGVGERFPDLAGAVSTEYYADNERRLFTEYFPPLDGIRLLKTDLWDEAKNTRILAWASTQGAHAYGVDIAAATVIQARRAFDSGPGAARHLRCAIGDVRSLPFADGSFDAIYSMGTIEHFAETEQAVEEIARVLKPGGRAIVGVPNRHDPFLRPLFASALQAVGLYGYGYEKSYSRRTLRQMLERAGFAVVAETAILFIPGWLRMLDLACHAWYPPLASVTGALVRPFVFLDRHVPFVRQHGYLLATVVTKPHDPVRTEADRHAVALQLHQSERMQSLGTLAGGVAHDFNNILTAITGYAELAKEQLPPGSPALASLDTICQASQRARELVKQILTFSRHDAPQRRPLALQGIIAEAITLLRATLPESVRIRTHIAADTPLVLADPTQVLQTLMNLGTNAAHAVSGNGTIDVRLESAVADAAKSNTLAGLPDGRYVMVSVSDTGCGMDSVTRSHVFEPLFTTKGPNHGTGFGLAVVHGIMRSHHGTVTVDSEPGQGATFRLYFPAIANPVAERPVPASEMAEGRNQHVVYVDDEEALVFLTSRILRRLGYRVTGYTDPAVALQTFRASPNDIDAFITDSTMPGLSGLDLVREIRRVRPDLAVAMVSGYMTPIDLERARHLGVTEIVSKPHTPRDLSAALQRIMTTARVTADPPS